MPDAIIYKPWEKNKLLLKQLLHAAQNNAAVSEYLGRHTSDSLPLRLGELDELLVCALQYLG